MSQLFISLLLTRAARHSCSRHELTTAMQHLYYHPCGFPHVSVGINDSMSSPGEVFRFVSNWTTRSTGCAGPRQFLWVLVLRPYSPGGSLNVLTYAPARKIYDFASEPSTYNSQPTTVTNKSSLLLYVGSCLLIVARAKSSDFASES